MIDPLGLVGDISPIRPARPQAPAPGGQAPGGDFKTLLEDQIAKVNELQQDATRAIEDLAAGRRDDVENVMIATQKADTAFRMLLQVRNKVMDAYEDVKQLRV